MATSVRGRSGSRSRTTSGTYYKFSGRTSNMGWGRTNASGGRKGSAKGVRGGGSCAGIPTPWKRCSSDLFNKYCSYRTLYNQTKGPAKHGRPSPTTLNSFANWINKGAIVQTVTTAQVARWAKTTKRNFNTRTPTPTACKNVLCAKFGKSAIKAVARTKTGSFMVATMPVVNGKPFCFPK